MSLLLKCSYSRERAQLCLISLHLILFIPLAGLYDRQLHGRIAHGIRQKSEGEKVQRRVRDKPHYLTDFPMSGPPRKFDEYCIQPRKKTRLLKAFTKNVLFNSDPTILLVA